MPVSDSYKAFIDDQLSTFSEISSKRMFGGVGYFYQDRMFAMISDDVFRLKVDDSNRGAFEEAGMGPLEMKKKGRSMPYYEVPPDVLEDRDRLAEWVQQAFEVALRKKK